jgi:hypothetical protein
LQRRIYIAAIVVGALLLALVSRSVLETNRLIQHTLEEELNTHLQAIGLSVRESLSLADFTAIQARKQWLQEGRIKSHPDYVEDFPNFKDLISQVAIINQNGYLAASSQTTQVNPIYLGYREHFRVHRDSPHDAVFVSEPVIGRISQTRSVQFTRPIRDKDQQFVGVVVISLNPAYIEQNLFDRIGRPHHQVLLMGSDGRLRVGSNGQAGPEQPFNSANAHPEDPWRGQHFWKSQALDEYGLELQVGLPKLDIERKSQRTYALAAGAATLILLSGAFYARRVLLLVHERNHILQKLEDSQIQANC